MYLLAAGCGRSDGTNVEPAKVPGATEQLGHGQAHLHELICGCALPEVGKCGEFIKVDEKFVELTGDLNLGHMPFCKKKDLKAWVDGDVKDGKFIAKSFKYEEK